MQIFNRLLITTGLLYSAGAYAGNEGSFRAFADILYWNATETVDWAYSNSLSLPHQHIAYQSGEFDYSPGFRVGIGYEKNWDTELYFTKYTTQTSDSASGNLKSGFLGGTIGLIGGLDFYDSGQFKMDIDFNMIDWAIGKRFHISPALMIHPTIGIEGGWIDQSLRADLQGLHLTTEKIENNFWGVGPKFGVDGALTIIEKSGFRGFLIGEFSTAYLIGHWHLPDTYYDDSPKTIEVALDDRNAGVLALQAKLGVMLSYQSFSTSLSYEINDWFDQLQIFDDATGGHNNDLVLQGLTLRVSYRNEND
jgi:hypothetical protein